jgi:large subunit ribosomal protein L25
MQIPALSAERRENSGTKAMRKARADGRLPGVLYGKGKDNVNLLFALKDIEGLIKAEDHVVQLTVGGEQQYALVRALQRDHMGDSIHHIDFVRIDLAEKVRLRIPLSFLGTPKGATHGGLLEVSHGDIEVHCPADRIPKHLEIEVTRLEVGDAITVKDLALPEGAEPMLRPEVVVVKCAQARRADIEEAEAAAAPGTAAAAAAAAAAAVPSAKGGPPAKAEAAPAKGKEAKK